jgi:hypothetical protein
MEYLDSSELDDCTVCLESTGLSSNCCRLSICGNCYIEWLKSSRECMHCRKDQMDFNTWVDNYKIDNSPPPVSLIPLGFTATAEIMDGNNVPVSVNLTSDQLLTMFINEIENVNTINNDNSNSNSNDSPNIVGTINANNLIAMMRLMHQAVQEIEDRVLDIDEYLENIEDIDFSDFETNND